MLTRRLALAGLALMLPLLGSGCMTYLTVAWSDRLARELEPLEVTEASADADGRLHVRVTYWGGGAPDAVGHVVADLPVCEDVGRPPLSVSGRREGDPFPRPSARRVAVGGGIHQPGEERSETYLVEEAIHGRTVRVYVLVDRGVPRQVIRIELDPKPGKWWAPFAGFAVLPFALTVDAVCTPLILMYLGVVVAGS